jgi:hypothetical protein
MTRESIIAVLLKRVPAHVRAARETRLRELADEKWEVREALGAIGKRIGLKVASKGEDGTEDPCAFAAAIADAEVALLSRLTGIELDYGDIIEGAAREVSTITFHIDRTDGRDDGTEAPDVPDRGPREPAILLHNWPAPRFRLKAAEA